MLTVHPLHCSLEISTKQSCAVSNYALHQPNTSHTIQKYFAWLLRGRWGGGGQNLIEKVCFKVKMEGQIAPCTDKIPNEQLRNGKTWQINCRVKGNFSI